MQTVMENVGWGRRGERCAFSMLENSNENACKETHDYNALEWRSIVNFWI